MKLNLIEVLLDNCTCCRVCEMMCSLRQSQECSSRKSRIKILKGKEWAFDFPLLCIQCAEAPCMQSCPMEAFHRDETTGIVAIDSEVCNGCEVCLSVCPTHALALDEENDVVFKCDLCQGDPECVKWCTREALIMKEVDIDSPARKSYADKASRLLQGLQLVV